MTLRAQKARIEREIVRISSSLAAFFEALAGQELALSACLLAPPVTGCNQIQEAMDITRSHIAEEQLDLSLKQAQIAQINQQLASLRCDDIDERIAQLEREIAALNQQIAGLTGELGTWQAAKEAAGCP